MRVLIIGATGFIGRNLKEYFENKEGYVLLAPNRQELNVLDEKSVTKYLQQHQIDVVIHAAIYVCNEFKGNAPELILENDLRMFYNFEKNKSLYKKMIYFGSGAEYDKTYPIVDISENEIGESIPESDYGFAKYIIGNSILGEKNIYNLRIFGLFGKYENWRETFISNCCCKAVKGLPLTIRQNVFFDYMWIEDFCGIVEWFVNNTPKFNDYNITTGKKVDLKSIAALVNTISEKDLPIYVCQKGLGNEYTASNERLRKEIPDLNFTNLKYAIEKLYNWYVSVQNQIDIYSLLYQQRI